MLEKKIKTTKELKNIVLKQKKEGKKIAFTNGCFDILHAGHVHYLEEAKKLGDILIVAINSDSSIREIKGKNRPIINQRDRARIIAGLESVDYVTIFNESTPLKLIKLLRPDILIKGADWKEDNIIGRDFVLSYGGKIKRIRLLNGRSTTKIIKKILKKFSKRNIEK